MTAYLRLQFTLINRRLAAFGLPPLLAYVLFPVVFVWLSIFLFSKTEFAAFVYLLFLFGLLLKLTGKKRNEFLRLCYSYKNYIKLRVIENLIVATSFLLFCIYQKAFVFVGFILILSVVLAFVNLTVSSNFTLPTPFYKTPFEFTVGFRNTFYIFPLAYFFLYKAVVVNNFNLGVFSLLLIFLVVISYYFKLERVLYIWNYSLSPRKFLIKKIRIGLFNASLLCLPLVIVLGIFFTDQIETILFFLVMGYCYLITIILAKYSVYPNEMNLPQAVIITLSFFFPPALIAIIPYFYYQSTKRLKVILI